MCPIFLEIIPGWPDPRNDLWELFVRDFFLWAGCTCRHLTNSVSAPKGFDNSRLMVPKFAAIVFNGRFSFFGMCTISTAHNV